MSQTPNPEPDTDDPQAHAAERLGGPLGLQAVYERPHYPGQREGTGRWFVLEHHGEELGVVWCNMRDGIGFIPTTQAGRLRTPDMVAAFSHAAQENAPVLEVWDYWSSLGGLGLGARPEESGDLATLDTLSV